MLHEKIFLIKESIIANLIIGLVIFSIYLNKINGNFLKLYKNIDDKINSKLIGQSIILIFLPLFIWSIYIVFQKQDITTSNGQDFIIPIQIQSALLSALISWLISSRQNKTEFTFDLHREFNNKEMYAARSKADRFLLKLIKDSEKKNYNLAEIYENDTDKSEPLLLVLIFYQRLWIAIDNKQVNPKLISKLFGQNFYWWYINCFEEKLTPTNWESKDCIEELKIWLARHTNQEVCDEWIKWAKKEREERRRAR